MASGHMSKHTLSRVFSEVAEIALVAARDINP